MLGNDATHSRNENSGPKSTASTPCHPCESATSSGKPCARHWSATASCTDTQGANIPRADRVRVARKLECMELVIATHLLGEIRAKEAHRIERLPKVRIRNGKGLGARMDFHEGIQIPDTRQCGRRTLHSDTNRENDRVKILPLLSLLPTR